ncbi:hypothetical protein ID855_12985 [Xenorhabdus sp. ZM]|uniref:hypothetical protein n=1 Tax=Xenorhabdus szentirmaii TaxID=290112 RepID=UPI0019C64A57|nr:hypothetical protein [Xenorhabdus sp. ZM]MBD2805590.1 hypothetical protein [Xenorhabdus sp. ZM]
MSEISESSLIKQFSVFYDAQDNGFNTHKMNAYDLGMSILEIAKMVHKADKLLNGDAKSIELQVTAPAREGSFAIDFIAKFINNKSVDVLKYLGFSEESANLKYGDALTLARSLKGERIISIVTETGSDIAKIELDDREVECDKFVASLVANNEIRQAMNEVITQPLSGKNSPIFRVEVNGREIIKLEGESTQDYIPLPKNSLSHSSSRRITTNVSIIQVNFESETGWRMLYDGKPLTVKMGDESFMARVKDNVKSFTKGDMFEVELEIINKTTAKSNSTQYIITRVIRHRALAERRLV